MSNRPDNGQATNRAALPPAMVQITLLLCILPLMVHWTGVGATGWLSGPPRLTGGTSYEAYDAVAGLLLYSVLEWTACCVAMFTVLLAYLQYAARGDANSAVIAMALIAAGMMDGFQAVAADRLVESGTDVTRWLPITWVIGRTLHATLVLTGVGLVLATRPGHRLRGPRAIIMASCLSALAACCLAQLLAVQEQLPQVHFPDALVCRPWDVLPLLLYLLAGAVAMPRAYRQEPSFFAHALQLSLLPNAVAQVHMAFGSRALFDSQFIAAYLLKILAYLVPLMGLAMDYLRTAHREQRAVDQLTRATTEHELFWALSRDLLCVAGYDGRFRRINPAWSRALGWSDEELRQTSYLDLLHPADRPAVEESLASHAAGGQLPPLEVRCRAKDGDYRWLLFNATTMPELGLLYAVAHDITQRKQAESTAQRLGRIMAASPTEIYVFDAATGVCLQASSGALAGLGQPAGGLAELTLAEVIRDADERYLAELLAPLREGRTARLEFSAWHQRRDGGSYPVDARLEYSEAELQPVYILTAEDVTARREAERAIARTMTELERSNAELEQFAYVASHDLQEPLRKVRAFGDRLRERYSDRLDERGLDYLERMQRAAERMHDLIQALLNFSRVTTRARPFQPVDLAALASEVTSDLEVRLEEAGGEVVVGELPEIVGDPVQLRQLLQNLIGNALKFRRPETPPVVRVSGELVTDGVVRPAGLEGAGPWLRLVVADNGIGFDPRYAEQIFGVFQRLHGRDEYEGTGIGLAICRKIAERHCGVISASGEPGRGAEFVVWLPTAQPEQEEGEA